MISIALSRYFIFICLFFFLSVPTNLIVGFNLSSIQNTITCIESERQTLLSFKQELVDRYDILSSWGMQVDCCNWKGVRCSHNTGHIVRLDLHGLDDITLEGKVGSSLAQLSHLNYLDLSNNRFDRIVLEDIGSLIDLNYLNLSYNQFVGVLPPHLGNLSKLSILDFGSNFGLVIKVQDNLQWLYSLSSLKHLDLSTVDFRNANNWANIINNLTLLQSLSLRSCNLAEPILPWLINSSDNLAHLNLAFIYLQGFNIDDLGNMSSLVFLDLSFTEIDFRSPKFFKNLSNLKSLYLSQNDGEGLLYDFLKLFPQSVLNSLQYLHLASNKFYGFLPNFTMFPSLKGLDLSNNMLNGTIPLSLGQLLDLEYLYLGRNSLEGEVYEAHFSKLTNLRGLNLSGNSLNLNLKSNWVPPFQLESIFLRSCKLGPLFPNWLQTQNFSSLDISNAEISDVIPTWFWNNLSPKLKFMDLSGNEIDGEISNLSLKLKNTFAIILKSNKFVGQIPSFLLQVGILDLSNNKFSGVTHLCEVAASPLLFLDLSNNQLSGPLPNCWDHMHDLNVLSLANNNFSGEIPYSTGNLTELSFLNLRNNHFSKEFPYWFNFTNLVVFDVMNNNLSGKISSLIGSKLPNLVRLSLKSNHFHGNLPSSLCNFRRIAILDISSNNITGSVPTCFRNFSVLTQPSDGSYAAYGWDFFFDDQLRFTFNEELVMMWKGQEKSLKGQVLQLGKSIDLSCNHLSGEIPNEITDLVGLISLNLSRNELTGQIPNMVGQLQTLDSLDLSRNRLSGPIPSSLSQISRLGVLDLSYNNLSGNIPTGTQLQGFSTSSYEGNPYLYGYPLKSCFEETTKEPSLNNIPVENRNENEDRLITRDLFISMSFGYVVGFWGLFGSLILQRRWRHAYLKLLRDITDKVTRKN